jgi:tetratricopeptide (TPR) repeat protein
MAAPPHDPEPETSAPGKFRRITSAFGAFHRWTSRDSREFLWDGLDFWEESPRLRRGVYVTVPLAVLAIAAGIWGHAHWSRNHAVAIGRQWLAAGRLDRAEIATRDAIRAAPTAPEPWQLAAAVAWRLGMKAAAVDDLRKAAFLSHNQPGAIIAWADAAILADYSDQAGAALALLTPDELSGSAGAERAKGEWLRRKGSYGDAIEEFQAALDLDRNASRPSLAIDEIPLGVALLYSGKAGDHERGVALLDKWSGDAAWGAPALRELLADAIRHNDHVAMPRWAEALGRHPRFSMGDVSACLQGIAVSDPERFQAMLRSLEQATAGNPEKVAKVMGALNRLGRTSETLEWAKSIPLKISHQPPIAVELAEALRQSNQWRELSSYVDRCEWGRDLEFLHLVYGMIAAKHLGDTAKAQDKLKTMLSTSRWNGGQALIEGDLLFGWASDEDALTLLWSASESPGGFSVEALGTLVRIYQVKRDGDGEYRVFARLATLRPGDRDFGNNLAYFAVMTGQGNNVTVENIARDNFQAKPDNIYYRSTWALVLCRLGKADEALRVMEPVASDWTTSSATAWGYGAALAGVGRTDEAKRIFDTINPDKLSFQEIAWVHTLLK